MSIGGLMMFFAVAFGVLLHALFWGAGLAVFVMPQAWRRFWPVLALPAGFALQSLVVWLGAYANLPGTNSYAWWSEILPAALLGAAAARRGAKNLWSNLGRFGVLAALVAGCLALIVLPMAIAARGLTTLSLGSCDAADYAAGARVFMEFAHGDRSGFLGLTEVVRTASADNFYDFWLRLNHFTPSALIALNGTIFHCAPHELTGVLTAVLLAASMPGAFWIARAVIGYNSLVSIGIALLYGLSPLGWYAVAHVTMGQWLAAQGIVLLTWAGVALWRTRLTPWRALAFGGVLAIGYALVLGAYNFVLLVGLVPAVAYAGACAVVLGEWRRFAGWLIAMLAPLAVVGAIFFERVAGLIERFRLFRTFDFGWRIPALTPEGWLGMVSGPELQPWRWLGLRWMLAAAVVALLALAFARAVRLRRRAVWTAVSISVPVLLGYAFLEGRGRVLGTNASYDAYKLFAVFQPGLLAAACGWVTLRRGRAPLAQWPAVVATAGAVLMFNLVGDGMFFWAMCRAPLAVGGELKQLRKIEAMPDVASVNLRVPDMWSRLWANEFLLRKPQYFSTDTYEGRWHTPPHGDWDLESGIVAVNPGGGARRQLTPHYALVDTRGPTYLRAALGDGWHQDEFDPKTGDHWRWTKGDATVRIENPHATPLVIAVTLDGWSFRGDPAVTLVGADGVATPPVELGTQRVRQRFAPITVPPGNSALTLHLGRRAEPENASAGARKLGVCVFGLMLDVRAK